MTRLAIRTIFAASILFAVGPTGALAAEIHFRAECRVEGGLVLLSDVAEIYDADQAQMKTLGQIDLLPAPPAKERRVLRVREIQDLLYLRGVNPNDHRYSGASQVMVLGIAEGPVQVAAKKAGYLNVPMQQITKNVRDAVLDYLHEKSGSDVDWIIKFDLKPQDAQDLAAAGKSLQLEGGASPWTGLQNLTLSYPTHDGRVRVTLVVQVSAPPTVVVASQNLARGAIIRASDVRLQVGKPSEGSVYIYRTTEEVVGKEAARPIVEGQILDDQFIRRPVLVQRSDIVTVYARSAGLRVRTTGRAMEAGGEGDLVRVESVSDRKSYFARVTGPQEVEVFAHAPTATGDTPSTPTEPRVQQTTYRQRSSSIARTGAANVTESEKQ